MEGQSCVAQCQSCGRFVKLHRVLQFASTCHGCWTKRESVVGKLPTARSCGPDESRKKARIDTIDRDFREMLRGCTVVTEVDSGCTEGETGQSRGWDTESEIGSKSFMASDLSQEDAARIAEGGAVVYTNDADLEVSDDEVGSVNTESTHLCRNCRREEGLWSEEEAIGLKVVLSEVDVTTLNLRHKWKSFTRGSLPKSTKHVLLCQQCAVVLRRRGKPRFADAWPIYIWNFVSDADLMDRHKADLLHYIPVEWWKYWKRALCAQYPVCYDYTCFTVCEGFVNVVRDRTGVVGRLKGALERLKLGELQRECDELLCPLVNCPWGCSGYYHDAGSVSFDAVMHRYFPTFQGSGLLSTLSERQRMASARSDFMSTDVLCHLFNSEWSVTCSVRFQKDGEPVFMTCVDHDGGTKEKYFHIPRTDNYLPGLPGDQLAFCVLRARTLKRAKAKKYSDSYQMNLFKGNYSGVDSTWVSDSLQDFEFHSHVLDVTEARSYAHRVDIRGLAERLKQHGVLTREFVETLRRRSAELFPIKKGVDTGATMMTLCDAMQLQRSLSEPQFFDVEVVDGKGGSYVVSTQKKWPTHLIHVHPCDSFGALMAVVPDLKQRTVSKTSVVEDSRILWFLCNALVSCNALWAITCAGCNLSTNWHAYLLVYCARSVLGQSYAHRDKTSPYYLPRTHDKAKPASLLYMLLAASDGRGRAYDAGLFEKLYLSEAASNRVQFLKFRFMSTLAVDDDCEMLWFVNKPFGTVPKRKDIRDIPLTIMTNGGKFELRVLAASDLKADENFNRWTGSFWMRHGTSVFPSWWGRERSGKPSKHDDYREFDWPSVDFAIYVRCVPVDLEAYRCEYLKYIGGQSHVFCEAHDSPLITACTGRGHVGRQCTGLNNHANRKCTEKEKWQCPFRGCALCLCDKCFRTFSVQERKYIGYVASDPVAVSKGADLVDTDSEHSFSEPSVDSSDTYVSRERQYTDDDECDSLCESNGTTDNFDLATGFDDVGYGTGDAAPEVVDEELEESAFFTSFATDEVLESSGEMRGMGTSVLLNKCGSLLVRRKSRLQATRREQYTMQRVVSRAEVGSVPLVYLEGLLFPSIFWDLPGGSDAGVSGSVPTVLFCQHETRKKYGIASLAAHAKTRLKSVGSSAATDPRYLSFMFDTLANGALEGTDTRIVLSRGFEACMGPAGMRLRDKDDDLYSDGIDNRQNVHNLCASEREKPSTLFLTLTCNQSQHFGIRRFKNYIDRGEAVSNYKAYLRKTHPTMKALSARAELEVERCLREAARSIIVRNWLEVKKILIDYLLKSPDLPLGVPVEKIFARDEYQGDTGNLCHMHILLTLVKDYTDVDGRKSIQNIVRGFVQDIVTEDEVPVYLQEGILTDYTDYLQMQEDARNFLPHRHSERCMRRTGTGSSDLRCRVPDTRFISGDITRFFEAVLAIRHSKESVDILRRIGMFTEDSHGELVPLRPFLKASRIYPPVRFGEGNITPVIGRLFAGTRSTMNVQVCTSHGTSRYVVKYVVKVDENNYVAFSSKRGEKELVAEQVFLHNTKITSSAANEKKRLEAGRDSTKPRGRAVAATEMMQIILGKPQVYCNMRFERVSTLPLGERPGLERQSPQERYEVSNRLGKVSGQTDSFDFAVPLVAFRTMLFPREKYRRHTDSQVLMLRDQMQMKVSLDKIFIFGVRPPELLSIDRVEWYFKFFVRSNAQVLTEETPAENYLRARLNESSLLDGLGHRVRIRVKAIPFLGEILDTLEVRRVFQRNRATPMLNLLQKICRYYKAAGITVTSDCPRGGLLTKNALAEWNSLQKQYVAYYSIEEKLPIVVFSNVKPRNACKFAIHLVLSMGHFETERDIWAAPSMRDAFFKAGLIPSATTCSADDVDSLLSRWIDDQLKNYPIGAKLFDEFVVRAHRILTAVLVNDTIPITELPPVMYTSLVQHTNEKIDAYLADAKNAVVEATLATLKGSYDENLLPTLKELQESSKHAPVPWDYRSLPRGANQSSESYKEQREVLADITARIDSYARAPLVQPKNFLIAGPPGVGKTHCMTQAICYGLARGLFCMTTALLADRAVVLGGKHLHLLFKLRPRDQGTPHRIAELAVIALQRTPETLALLRKIDILFMDECGQVSTELVSVTDIIMRKVRGSDLFMGGVLVNGTIDQVQLRPIHGLPFLLSPYVITTFRMKCLKCYVRCAKCPILQRMNEMCRTVPTDPDLQDQHLAKLADLFRKNCTFVSSWDSEEITDSVMRVFPRRSQASDAVRRFLDLKKCDCLRAQMPYYTVLSEDAMVAIESHAEWKVASQTVTNMLNSKCKEPRTLDFYPGAIYQFTYNSPGRFKSTQLGVLLAVPDQDVLSAFKDIDIYVAPAGMKTLHVQVLTEAALLEVGFRKTRVGSAPDRSHQFWKHGIKGRRKQYALKHHIASTVHSAIGHTVLRLATELSKEHTLWEKAMVVVLVSRVHAAIDLIFVGNKEENIAALIEGLRVRNQYDEYMDHIVDILTQRRGYVEPICLDHHPFRFKDIPLPMDTSGVVYMLVSLRTSASMYIGSTKNMVNRLRQHNTGFGAKETAPPENRPYGLYCYITGFCGDKDLMTTVERRWQSLVSRTKPDTCREAAALAVRMTNREFQQDALVVVLADTL